MSTRTGVRALVMVTLCYGALEIVGLLLLLLLLLLLVHMAAMALRRHIDLSVGCTPGPDWRRRPDRPRARWINQIRWDLSSSPVELWRRAIRRGRARCSDATQRPP